MIGGCPPFDLHGEHIVAAIAFVVVIAALTLAVNGLLDEYLDHRANRRR